MDKGIYTLILRTGKTTIRAGALGNIDIPEGYLIYVGSALGPGGLIRVQRHLTTSQDRRKPHWHIDYLLQDEKVLIIASISAETTSRLECPLAEAIGGAYIPNFGSSDCKCRSHLFLRPDDPTETVALAFASLGLIAAITRY
ncbi:GIY-YIG nuclease family protein [Methanocalculus taiwanensis]|uniref:GIY-YIG nuclease family protein n=1 Tax=Methanocalculus taiwanensis TaxID=106207 RepID=A0ABD4TLB0_9EURY|nr:GIY-YIG nuclease family protein [Methanocalculus taiwanensis]MCQ1539216.1 GIY-YIG nuclease family protein [Methanocalculus taiwanensis]